MTTALTVPVNERGMVRIFALDMPPEQARFLREPGAVDGVLGVLQVDPAYVEIFPVSDLQEVGLAGYLTEGCGLPEDQIAADRARLDAQKGYVMIVLSRAFGGRAVTLHVASELNLIATYSEEPTDWTATPIQTDSARSHSGMPRSPRAARSQARRTGGTIFAVCMVIIFAVILMVIL